MLLATATVEARVPAAPLTPQNQAVGLRSIAEISLIPVGNPKPSNKPAGAIVTAHNMALDNRLALSNARNTPDSQWGSAATYAPVTSAQIKNLGREFSGRMSETRLTIPVDKMRVK